MSLGDYLLPWKAIPNMIRDVKDAGGGSKDGEDGKRERNHSSVVGAIGKYADPVGALLGDSWMDFWHDRLPTKLNEYASGIAQKDPFIQLDRKYGLGQKGSPLRGVSNFAEDRPADTTALVLGAIFGGGAALGGAGGGSAGGGASAGGSSGGFAGLNWSDPNTYMQLAQAMPQQGAQQPPPAPPPPPPQHTPRRMGSPYAQRSADLSSLLAALERKRVR